MVAKSLFHGLKSPKLLAVPFRLEIVRGDKLVSRRRVPCVKSVPESDLFMLLELALSEKQIAQITENTEK